MMIVVRVIADGLFYTVTLSRAMVTETRAACQCACENPFDDLVDIPTDAQDRFHAQLPENVLSPRTHSAGHDQVCTLIMKESGDEPRLMSGIRDNLPADNIPIDDVYDGKNRAMPEMGEYFIIFC